MNRSDGYVVGLASLLQTHWLLPGYQPDYCPPGGTLVFELRRRGRNEHLVRVYFTAQTFDQLRDLAPLSHDNPPATVQLLVPQSGSSKGLDVDLRSFLERLRAQIDWVAAQDPVKETPAGELRSTTWQ